MSEERWRDLSDNEKKMFGGSKSTFQAAKEAARAGGGDVNRSKSIRNFIPKASPAPSPAPSHSPAPSPAPSHSPAHQEAKARVQTYQAPSNLQNFDLKAHGAGSNKGTTRISGADIRLMEEKMKKDMEKGIATYTADDIIRFAEGAIAGGAKYGGNTTNKLNKLKAQRDAQNQQPQSTPAPTQPSFTPKPVEDNRSFGDINIGKPGISHTDKGEGGNESISLPGGTSINKTTNQVIQGDTGKVEMKNSENMGTINTGIMKVDQSVTAVPGGSTGVNAQGFLDSEMAGVMNAPTNKVDNQVNQSIQGNTGDVSMEDSLNMGLINTGQYSLDQSLTIFGPGKNTRGPGFSNMQLGALANATLDLEAARERTNFPGGFGLNNAMSTLAVAKNQMDPTEKAAGYNRAVDFSIYNDLARADNYTTMAFGDIFNPDHLTFNWQTPKTPKKAEPDYDIAKAILNA